MFYTLAALVIFLFPLAYSPGPGNMVFSANGARFGFAATLPANIGYHLATFIVTAAIGLGFVAAMDKFHQASGLLRVAGSLYVLWLSWTFVRAGAFDAEYELRPARFVDGVMVMLLNPKAYVIIMLMFTQFIDRMAMGMVAEALLITTIFTLNNLIAFSIWTWVGDALTRRFRTAQSARRLNMLFGALLALVALWMLVV